MMNEIILSQEIENLELLLIEAVKQGRKNQVEEILFSNNSTININYQIGDSGTPLYCSIINGHEEIFDLLIQKGTNLDILVPSSSAVGWTTPLQLAVEMNRLSMLRKLLDVAEKRGILPDILEIKAMDRGGTSFLTTPSQIASKYGNIEAAQILAQYEHIALQNNSTRRKEVSIGEYPKMMHDQSSSSASTTTNQKGIKMDGNIEDKYYLIQFEGDTDKKKRYSLQNACSKGDNKKLDLLLRDYGIGLIRNSELIHLASHHGHMHTLQYLIDKGADMNELDHSKWNALHWASYSNRIDIVKLLWVVYPFLRDQITGEGKIYGLETVLHVASRGMATQSLKFILDQNYFNIDVADQNGKTPLHWAIEADAEGCAILLIKRGANINARDKFGNMPFKGASGQNLLASLLDRASSDSLKDEDLNDTRSMCLVV